MNKLTLHDLNVVCEARYKQGVGIDNDLLQKVFKLGFLEGAKVILEIKECSS